MDEKEYKRLYDLKHKEEYKQYRKDNRSRDNEKKKLWRKNNPDKERAIKKRYNQKNKDKVNAYNRMKHAERKERVRLEVYTHYSGGTKPQCACCGECNMKFLNLDHENGRDDSEIGKRRGMSLVSYLKRMGYPEGIQVSCWNCNCGRALNGGICPHKTSESLPKINN